MEDGLDTATMNGFTSETMDCPVLFADAPKGLRSVEYETNGKYIRKVHIAPAIAEADILLSLAHFKCHDCMGIGGALKNVGVGCSSKRGKWWIHHKDRLEITSDRCNGCGDCLSACPAEAIVLEDSKARIITEKCVDCGFCIDYCSEGAFTSRSFPNIEEQEARIAESAAGIVKYFDGRCGFVNLAIDITPLCDCDPFVGIPIVPDLGVLASKDPVSLDRACVDLVNTSLGVPTSMAESADAMGKGMDKINTIAKMRWEAAPGATHVSPDWKVMLKAAEEANLGTQRYRLAKVNFGHPPRNVEDLFSEYEKRKKA